MSYYEGQSPAVIEALDCLPNESKYPDLMFTEGQRTELRNVLEQVKNGAIVSTGYLLGLYDQATYGASIQARYFMQEICKAMGPEYFTEQAQDAYIAGCERDTAGLVPGYDSKVSFFAEARAYAEPAVSGWDK